MFLTSWWKTQSRPVSPLVGVPSGESANESSGELSNKPSSQTSSKLSNKTSNEPLNEPLNEPSSEPYEIVMGARSDVGCVRELNEDSILYYLPPASNPHPERGVLVVLADGMGGHAAGEVASRMAVDTVKEAYYALQGDCADALRAAVEEANRRILRASQEIAAVSGMGTTCTALALRENTAYVAHVGDSRVYRIRNGEMQQLSQDHTTVMEMVRKGLLSEEEAHQHPDRYILSQAVGTQEKVDVYVWSGAASVGDRYLLCSDGLHDLVTDEEMLTVLQEAPPADACEAFVSLAKTRGGKDNITAAVICLVEAGTVQREVAGATQETRVIA